MVLFAAFLPSRWWGAFPSLQIERFALLSALGTVLLGFLLAIFGYFEFAESGGVVRSGPGAPLVFGLTTPLGLLSTYLILSGTFRAATAFVGDWYGDPLLTGIVTAIVSTSVRGRDAGARANRLRREGIEVPDQVHPGEWADLPQAEIVVVASRRKKDWQAGVVVLTQEKSYRLGVPFDQTTPEGLRTIYPLTPLEPGELIRRSVHYELPPLEDSKPPC